VRDFLEELMSGVDENGSQNPSGATSPQSKLHVDEDGLASMRAVVLAGGRGTRLAPYTSILPKPLIPMGERAILEIVVDQLEAHGVRKNIFCVGYLSHLIRSVFENRANGHVNIRYVQEQEALGTARPLRFVDDLDDTFIVMNGDVLTTLDYRALVRHHRQAGNAVTIATRERTIELDYGVLHVENGRTPQRVVRFDEKPELHSTIVWASMCSNHGWWTTCRRTRTTTSRARSVVADPRRARRRVSVRRPVVRHRPRG
jgi:UTP-glucose-1-phosphate uridylyltransferase